MSADEKNPALLFHICSNANTRVNILESRMQSLHAADMVGLRQRIRRSEKARL